MLFILFIYLCYLCYVIIYYRLSFMFINNTKDNNKIIIDDINVPFRHTRTMHIIQNISGSSMVGTVRTGYYVALVMKLHVQKKK